MVSKSTIDSVKRLEKHDDMTNQVKAQRMSEAETIPLEDVPAYIEALQSRADRAASDSAELLAMVQRLLLIVRESCVYGGEPLNATRDAESLLARITKATNVADDNPSKDRPTESVQSAQTGGLS
jgi:hypothetical protein